MKKNVFDQKKFAAAILDKREKKNLSFRAIEAETGISKTTLQKLETGTVIPAADTLAEVCNWLNVSVSNFFTSK